VTRRRSGGFAGQHSSHDGRAQRALPRRPRRVTACYCEVITYYAALCSLLCMFAGIVQDDNNSQASEEDEDAAEEEDEEQTIFPDL
jgi:hypothetical protein